MKIAFADRDLLLQALADLGYETEDGDDLRITNGVKSVKVDFLVKVPYTDSVGFRKGKNGWQLTADWFRVNMDRKEFENRLKQPSPLSSAFLILSETSHISFLKKGFSILASRLRRTAF